jgi:hypothetical protein
VTTSTPVSANRRESEVCKQKWLYCYALFHPQIVVCEIFGSQGVENGDNTE